MNNGSIRMEQKNISVDDSIAGISVRSWDGPGYKPVVRFGAWCFAELNHAEKFKTENLSYIERHLNTDETFILIEGAAVLFVGKEMARIPMEKFHFYNVKAGTWHQINTEPGARVLIVENADMQDEIYKLR